MIKFNRPLACFAVIFSAGIIFENYLGFGIFFYFSAAAVLAVLTGLHLKFGKDLVLLIAALAFLCGGLWLAVNEIERFSSLKQFSGNRVDVLGSVLSYPVEKGDKSIWDLEVDKIRLSGAENWHTLSTKERIRVYYWGGLEELRINCGMTVFAAGELKVPLSKRNPGEFDYREFLTHRKIYHVLFAYDRQDLDIAAADTAAGLKHTLMKYRGRFEAFVSTVLDEREAALFRGLLFGDKGGISEEDRFRFNSTGMGHVLAVSGLHVGFVLVLIFSMMAALRVDWLSFNVKRIVVISVVILALVCYCILTGFSVSVVRAAVMGVLGILAYYLQREKDLYLTLSCALFIILIWNPHFLFEAGLQLSFLSVLSIIYLTPLLNQIFCFLPKWNNLFTVPLAVQLGIAPIIVYHFSTFSPIAVLSNVLLVWLIGIAVTVGVLILLIFIVCPPAAQVFLLTEEVLLRLLFVLVELLYNVSGGPLFFSRPGVFVFFAYYFSLIAVRELSQRSELRDKLHTCIRTRWRPVLVSVFLTIFIISGISFWEQKNRGVEFVFFDVGQGDSVFVRTPSDRCLLIDGGGALRRENASFDPGKDIVAPFLRREGVDEIDFVISTHPDADHLNGLYYILDSFNVKYFVTPPVDGLQGEYEEILFTAERQDVRHVEAAAGTKITLDADTWIRVLSPAGDRHFINSNNNSLVLQIFHKTSRFLMPGDIEHEGLEYLADSNANCQGVYDVVMLPHHGSEDAFYRQFFDKLQPRSVVISVGRDNSFGHPSSLVIEYWDERGVPVYRTDNQGAVMVESSGRIFDISTVLE